MKTIIIWLIGLAAFIAFTSLLGVIMYINYFRPEPTYLSPLSGGTRGIPMATESAFIGPVLPHPSSDKEIDQEHALCFIAIIQGVTPWDTHCEGHKDNHVERNDFWEVAR